MGVNNGLNKLTESPSFHTSTHPPPNMSVCHCQMPRNDSFQCNVDFSVCGGKKKQKIMYKSAKNAGKLTLCTLYYSGYLDDFCPIIGYFFKICVNYFFTWCFLIMYSTFSFFN